MIRSANKAKLYFYIDKSYRDYTSTLKDARAVLKISKLCEFDWFEDYYKPDKTDTSVYSYLRHQKESSHGY